MNVDSALEEEEEDSTLYESVNKLKFTLACKIIDDYIQESDHPNYCVLDSQLKPDILLSDYMIMVIKNTKTPHPLLHLCHAINYMGRYLRICKFELTAFNAHRLALTALLLTRKQLDDCLAKVNKLYAKKGGVSLREINILESHLFNVLVSSHLHVSYEDIKRLYMNLITSFRKENKSKS